MENQLKVYVASSWKNDWQPEFVSKLRSLGFEVYDFRSPHETGPSRGRQGLGFHCSDIAPLWKAWDPREFRNALRGRQGLGFHWSDIDPLWKAWDPREFRNALKHPIALAGFAVDMDALRWSDAVVMLQPCGRSSALELGYACGQGKITAVVLSPGEPELMLSMADYLGSAEEVMQFLVEARARIEEP